MAQKVLLGKTSLTAGVYDFVLPTQINTSLPNALANIALQEVYIVCNSSLGAITITLPEIALFNGSWNAKIYISDESGTASINNITILTPVGNTINSAASIVIDSNYSSVMLAITGATQWIGVNSNTAATIPGFELKKFTVNYTQYQPNATNSGQYFFGVGNLLPAGAVIMSAKLKHTVAWQGGTITQGAVVLEDPTGATIWSPQIDLFVPPTNTLGVMSFNETITATTYIPNQVAGSDLSLRLTVSDGGVGGTIDELVQGSLDIWFVIYIAI